MPYDQQAVGFGSGGADMRDRITQALMNVQNPPPQTQMPQAPSLPHPAQMPAAAQPTSTGAMGGGMPGAGGMPMQQPGMPMPGMPPSMPGMQPGMSAAMPGMPGAPGGVQQQPQAAPMGGRY